MALTTLPPSTDTVHRARYDLTTPVVHVEGTRTVVDLWGEWDLATRPVLWEALSRVIALPTGDVVIDLAEAKLIDTSTVRVLATGQQLLDRQGRTLTFRSPSRVAARALHLFGLTDLIESPEGDER
jgi:anti-anti-sigma factor